MTDKAAAAKEWLNRNEDTRIEIHGLLLKLEEMRQAASRLVASVDDNKVQTQPDPRRTENKILRIVEFEEKICSMRVKLEASDMVTLETIKRLPNAKERQVLMYRYYNGLPWGSIACILNYTENYCFELHRDGLEHIADLIDYTVT